MPYYLRRHFGDSTQVDVLNQLCVSTGGLVSRIDQYCMLGACPGLLVAQQRRRLVEFLVLKHRPHLARVLQEAAREGAPGR